MKPKALYNTIGSKIFDVFNYIFLAILALSCLLPMIHVVALSFSDAASAGANEVLFLPRGFNVAAYQLVFRNKAFLNSFFISLTRVVLGCTINLLLVILAAYPLSKEEEELKGRNFLSYLFIIPMLISGGLIPNFILVKNLHLLNTIWALILPGAVNIFYVVLMMNFFRGVNKSITESAAIDGAGEFVILARIMLPLSLPSIATISLFSIVGHWNEWFGGLIYMKSQDKWPLQTLLKQMMDTIDVTQFSSADITLLTMLSDRSFRAAQIVFATLPILLVYPFMQRYFIAGMTLGSVKE